MQKNIIYLVGQISMDAPESYYWRQEVVRLLGNDPQFELINPCNNEFNKEVLTKKGTDPNRLKIYNTNGVDVIVPKDRTYVKNSTMAFANLNIFDKDKPTVGTMFELAWYYDAPEKCVIGIVDGDPKQHVIANHPFVRATVDVWVNNVEEACELAKQYFTV
jgi:nucleoside 2-deoxyribosyltransferase